MAQCPHCHREINTLVNTQTGWGRWTVYKHRNGIGMDDHPDFESDGIVNQWECSSCGEVLDEIKTNEDAIAFLNPPPPTLLERESKDKRQSRFAFHRRK